MKLVEVREGGLLLKLYLSLLRQYSALGVCRFIMSDISHCKGKGFWISRHLMNW